MSYRWLALVYLCWSSSCRSTRASTGEASEEGARAVGQMIDAWHRAAAAADGERYFDALVPDAVFLGTDAGERWTKPEFHAYAEPHFSQGKGWAYVPRDRHISFSADQRTAWFDERLDNQKYGELRGTGVAVLTESGWRLSHYSLSFPIPNDLTLEVVARIRALTPSVENAK